MDDEAELIQQARHDPQAFALLYDRYVERIYAYSLRETQDPDLAQDIVSETFEKALKHLPSYQWRGTSFGAWLYKIARNEVLMDRRKRKWVVPLLGWFRSAINVEQIVQSDSERDAVREAMIRLSDKDQELLRLRYYEELSHEEIGQVLNSSGRNVAVRLHRALKRLRNQMERESREVVLDVTP